MGTSLLPYMKKGGGDDLDVYTELFASKKRLTSLRIGDRKILYDGGRRKSVIFDLEKDPAERRGLPPGRAHGGTEMVKRLFERARLHESIHRSLPKAKEETAVRDEVLQKRLKLLGYIDTEEGPPPEEKKDGKEREPQ